MCVSLSLSISDAVSRFQSLGIQGRAKKRELTLVREVPSGLIGGASAALS